MTRIIVAGALLACLASGFAFGSLLEDIRGLWASPSALQGSDLSMARSAEIEALEDSPDGGEVSWTNHETGSQGTVRILESFDSRPGASGIIPCRDFVHETWVLDADGQVRSSSRAATACLNPHEGWTFWTYRPR